MGLTDGYKLRHGVWHTVGVSRKRQTTVRQGGSRRQSSLVTNCCISRVSGTVLWLSALQEMGGIKAGKGRQTLETTALGLASEGGQGSGIS